MCLQVIQNNFPPELAGAAWIRNSKNLFFQQNLVLKRPRMVNSETCNIQADQA